ncbi:ABC transporter ATP-binding protein [Rickettsia endosymbiont of Ceutorhynchus obstrictus]|uniref:ABC transporter ATP-binding protein n=1 Tax=Rickettsia endosymbiont of Ceutorhynchus obstrictus TaxID=3066249 RepID=UPI0031332272
MQDQLPKTLFPFIWHFLRSYKSVVIIFVLLSLSAGFWGPFNSILIKHIINLLPQIQGGDTSILVLPASLIVLNFIVFDNFTWRGLTYIRCKFVPRIINHIIWQSMDYVLKKSHQFFQDNLSGKISKQITNLADGIEKLFSSVASNFLRGASLLFTAFVVAYFVSPIFCFILVIWFILFTGSSILMSKKLVSLSDAQAFAESIVVGELVDSLSNQSNIRIFARRSYENSRMIPYLYKQQKTYTAVYFYALIMHSIQGGLIAIMMAFSCYFLVHLYSKNLVTLGDFALILGLSMETGHIMWYTMSEVDEFNKAVGRCKQSLSALMMPLEIQDKPNAIALKCESGQITFDNVKFHYKGTEPLFQNKSIEIKAGQKVGLVGYSGSGKSTFVNLILRLYDITAGSILIDGQDICDVTQDSLRAAIAMIPQDPSLFHRSLMDNIRYGRINATDEEVIEAAKKAHAHEFITMLPHGYESLVGERGIKLSGGQRQRIAIARSFLKNAPILILDEATSQLDSVTESLIQESLWKLMQDKTTIIIAHRLSTLLHMDRILVFDKGKIVEDGTHNKLLTKVGLYKQLWDAQVGGFLGDEKQEDKI